MMKKIKLFRISFLLPLLALAGCNEQDTDDLNRAFPLKSDTSANGTQIVLGQKYDNPYSVRNMVAAYSDLKNSGEQIGNIQIRTTDLYVRFLPQDTAQYNSLEQDTNLVLFDYPLDYEIVQEGDYYHDPSIPAGEYTWLYTTVPVGYQFDPTIHYEILDSCYIANNNTEGVITDDDKLEQMSFRRLGLETTFMDPAELGAKGWFSGKKPQGTYNVYDNSIGAYVPIKGAQAVCHNIVKWGYSKLNANGHYSMNKKFHTKVYYKIKYKNEKGFMLRHPLTVSYDRFGFHNKGGYSKNIAAGDNRSWKLAVINNSAYEYYDICVQNKIQTPPENLQIMLIDFMSGGAAPLISRVNQYISISPDPDQWWYKLLSSFDSDLAESILNSSFVKKVFPDVIIGGKKYVPYASLYRLVCHELAHTSHFQQAGSNYWADYISYIINNNGYGNKNCYNAGVCGVGEMWGFAMAAILTKEKYGIGYSGGYWFRWTTLADLIDQGYVSKKSVYDCLNQDVRTLEQFKEKLIENNPSTAYHIETAFLINLGI